MIGLAKLSTHGCVFFIAVSRSHSGFQMLRRYCCTAVVTVTWLSRDLSFINKQRREARTRSLWQRNSQVVNVRTHKGKVISLGKLALSMFQLNFWPAPTSWGEKTAYAVTFLMVRHETGKECRFMIVMISLERSALTVSLTYFLDFSYPRSQLISFWFVCRLDPPFTGLQFLPYLLSAL